MVAVTTHCDDNIVGGVAGTIWRLYTCQSGIDTVLILTQYDRVHREEKGGCGGGFRLSFVITTYILTEYINGRNCSRFRFGTILSPFVVPCVNSALFSAALT